MEQNTHRDDRTWNNILIRKGTQAGMDDGAVHNLQCQDFIMKISGHGHGLMTNRPGRVQN